MKNNHPIGKHHCACGASLRQVEGIWGFDWDTDGFAFLTRGGGRETSRAIMGKNRHDVLLARWHDGEVQVQTSPGLCRGEKAA